MGADAESVASGLEFRPLFQRDGQLDWHQHLALMATADVVVAKRRRQRDQATLARIDEIYTRPTIAHANPDTPVDESGIQLTLEIGIAPTPDLQAGL